jgi:hypothetical protein
LIVIANDGSIDISLHNLIWYKEKKQIYLFKFIILFHREYFYQYLIPENSSIYHRNGITMDNRLENLLLISNNIFYFPFKSSSLNFYWNIISYLPVDMDEINYHNSIINESSLYECHNAPCTKLLINSSIEQFICLKCKKIK